MFYWNPSLTIGTGGNGYYIFCGPTKPGERRKPKDDIDACCQRHDKCYDKLDVSLFGKASLTIYCFLCCRINIVVVI